MNAKERFYSGLAKETIGKITSNTDNWTSFLRTMSRNYEFTYPEQVMIYAQRPNATFCKPYEDWNAENYRRYVKRGSTGIALFVMNRDKPYLRYVFDVADTGVRRSSPELKPWEVTPENRSYVMEAMERTFGVAADGVLEAQLEDIASALAAEYWDDYKKQFLDIVANSFLGMCGFCIDTGAGSVPSGQRFTAVDQDNRKSKEAAESKAQDRRNSSDYG